MEWAVGCPQQQWQVHMYVHIYLISHNDVLSIVCSSGVGRHLPAATVAGTYVHIYLISQVIVR